MKVGKFMASDWIDQLARALPQLAEAQAPYLQENYERYSRAHDTFRGAYGTESELPVNAEVKVTRSAEVKVTS